MKETPPTTKKEKGKDKDTLESLKKDMGGIPEPIDLTEEEDKEFKKLLRAYKKAKKEGNLKKAIEKLREFKEKYEALREEKESKEQDKTEKDKTEKGLKEEVFKTIEVGTFDTKEELLEALEESDGIEPVTSYTKDRIKSDEFELQEDKKQLDLVVKTVEDLGLEEPTYQEILDAAKKQGLVPPPAEVGPQLRLQYPDQSKDEWLTVAHYPVTGSDGDLNLFAACCSVGVRGLRVYGFDSGYRWAAEGRFVFVPED